MREFKRFLAVFAALVAGLVVLPAANAHQSPTGCLGTVPSVRFVDVTEEQLQAPLRDGDAVTLGVRISNQGTAACNLSGVTVRVRLPKPDGTPGELRTVASNISLAAGAAVEGFTEGEPYVVNLNETVFGADLGLEWEATIHSGATDRVASGTGTSVGFEITRPRAELRVVPDPLAGFAPLSVTRTYVLANISQVPPGGHGPNLVPLADGTSSDLLNDEACAPLSIQRENGSPEGPVLEPGDAWTFTCSRGYELPGTYQSRILLSASSSVDGRAWPQPAAGAEVTPVTVLGTDLTVEKSIVGDLVVPGGPAEYRIEVRNRGNLESSGRVTVRDHLPRGLALRTISGRGWTCQVATCHRDDPLAPGAAYPELRVEVAIAQLPPRVIVNRASVRGGGEPFGATENNAAEDRTTVRFPAQPTAPALRAFRVVKSSAGRNGSVRVRLRLPSAGRIIADDARSPNRLRQATRKVRRKGAATIRLTPLPSFRRQLRRSGKARVLVRFTFESREGMTGMIVRHFKFRAP